MDNAEIFDATKKILCQSLGVDEEEITSNKYLIEDLGAESIDFLDIFCLAEEELGIRVTQEDLGVDFDRAGEGEEEEDLELEINRELSDEELFKLREKLPVSTHSRIVPGLHVYEIIRLINVETLVNFFKKKVDEKTLNKKGN